MNPKIDQYLIDGCMRCKFGGTPECKVHDWKEELVMLRQIVLECGLTEELKWGVPCYTSNDKNIVIVSAFKEYASLSFFKGVLLKDPDQLLIQPGKSSQSSRLIKFTSTEQIVRQKDVLKRYVLEAVKIEASGKKIAFKKNPEPVPDELVEAFLRDPELEKAFFALTPGRQRGYILYLSQPKNPQTRRARIQKCKQKILQGAGLHDR